jgi:hypothetical protein
MKISDKAMKDLQESPAFATLIKHNRAMTDLFASDGWKIWEEWAKVQIEAYKTACFEAEDEATRNEARMMGQALIKFCALPRFLVELQQRITSTGSSDIPSDPAFE